MGWIVGLIIAAVLIVLLFAFGLPLLRGSSGTPAGTPQTPKPTQVSPGGVNVNVQSGVPVAPTGTTSSPATK
jgi:hypothetical protein